MQKYNVYEYGSYIIACCGSEEVSAPYRKKIYTTYERNSDQYSDPFGPNIGTKYHVILHRDVTSNLLIASPNITLLATVFIYFPRLLLTRTPW